ncbi:aldo/keto reductase [Mucilaginibacter hurinus]|uniref:Aldo/keto reductase n=1 Tax=Mucilaginibacter hurinus TaxID=2201324 RepID=A0A367GP34_9SPHI|nr:aldo/keto reductase [Mucilaginibacter hurinus]RCH55244.1 aldo/keto reductase [Mucilaginibacter hurinus]
MQYREIGKSGIQVAPLAFGGNVFGWTANEKTSFNLLDMFVDNGLNLIDTADMYSTWGPGNKGGESETIIGNWLKKSGKRNKAVIATKVGKPMGNGKQGLSKKYITTAVDDSLRRLQTDYIDLYQAHEDDPNTPLLETMETFDMLIKQGKVRAVGASNYSASRFEEALRVSKEHNIAAYQSLQPEYNLYNRKEFETEFEPLCLRDDIGVITFYALAKGFLTGKYRSAADLDKSPRGGGVKEYLNERGFNILNALDEVASHYATTPAAVAIAWVMARPGITAPIASATSNEQLNGLVKAAGISLQLADLELLNSASGYE